MASVYTILTSTTLESDMRQFELLVTPRRYLCNTRRYGIYTVATSFTVPYVR